eukprot:6556074-Prymnesium_polylepis.1
MLGPRGSYKTPESRARLSSCDAAEAQRQAGARGRGVARRAARGATAAARGVSPVVGLPKPCSSTPARRTAPKGRVAALFAAQSRRWKGSDGSRGVEPGRR